MYCVYVLRSEVSPNRSYIGYTRDPHRRLRQHNGEIKGGAAATEMHRPWKHAAIVYGFETISEAESFEWAMKHTKNEQGKTTKRTKRLAPEQIPRGLTGLKHRLAVLPALAQLEGKRFELF